MAALAGLGLGRRLPTRHLDSDTRDMVRQVAGFLGALVALVLGLLVASAKASYDQHRQQLQDIAANIVALDTALAHFGEGAGGARAALRSAVAEELDRFSAGGKIGGAGLDRPVREARVLGFYDLVAALTPQTDAERLARTRALQLVDSIAATRVLMTEDPSGSIPSPFLVVLVFWVAAMLVSFGLFALPNPTVVVALMVGAISAAGAVYLILELDRPLDGAMRLSTEPLRYAVESLGR
ncbi:MAG: hypothetical protein U1E59_14575 [Amaricoccus sp.]